MNKFEVLVDSDGWIAFYLPDDLLHADAVSIYERVQAQEKRFVTTCAVIGETATVLSHRSGQKLARQFLLAVEQSGIPVIFIDEKLYREALELFMQQETKGTSFVDCANVVVARAFEISAILSFDKFYGQQAGLKTV